MDQTLIQQYISQDLRDEVKNYVIPQEYISGSPQLIEKILASRSIDSPEEKQNWFNLLPMMNQEQISRLGSILDKEIKKLKEIEEKYEQKKKEIQQKYISKREESGYTRKVSEIRSQEEQSQEQDEDDADALLETL